MRLRFLISGAIGVATAVASLAGVEGARADGPLGDPPLVSASIPEAPDANEAVPIAQWLGDGSFTPAPEPDTEPIGQLADTLEPVAEAVVPVLQAGDPIVDAADRMIDPAAAILDAAAPLVEVVEQILPVAIAEVGPALPAVIKPLLPGTIIAGPPAQLEPVLPTFVTPVEPGPEPSEPSPRSLPVVTPAGPLEVIGPPPTGGQAAGIPPSTRLAPISFETLVAPIGGVANGEATPVEPMVPSSATPHAPAALASSNGSSRAPTQDPPTGAACVAALAVLGALMLSRGPRLAADTRPYSRVCLPAVPPG